VRHVGIPEVNGRKHGGRSIEYYELTVESGRRYDTEFHERFTLATRSRDSKLSKKQKLADEPKVHLRISKCLQTDGCYRVTNIMLQLADLLGCNVDDLLINQRAKITKNRHVRWSQTKAPVTPTAWLRDNHPWGNPCIGRIQCVPRKRRFTPPCITANTLAWERSRSMFDMRSTRGILEVRSATSRPGLPGQSPDISRPFHPDLCLSSNPREHAGFTEIHVAISFLNTKHSKCRTNWRSSG
jgi:hypothetical protein